VPSPDDTPARGGPSGGRAWTVRGLLTAAAEYLTSRGVDTARLDAERMLAEVLGTERLELYLEPERVVADEERARFRGLVRRRAAREPAQYILGKTEFYGLEFKVDGRALIPRRETELLVDRARAIAADRPVKALDLGTGCGCIAAARAEHLAVGSRVWATDVSGEALDLARENLGSLGLAGRVELGEGDLFGALAGEAAAAAFDIVAANLPYVESSAFAGLQPEVRDHEPRIALDGGPDGLNVVRRAVSETPAHMAPGGWLLLEVGPGWAAAVAALVEEAGLEPGPVLTDASGIERVVQGRKA
jgi:release factor glutamine methyltransferase